ncbi:hypothetical protein PIB30_112009, partial [Stylosanthes scabra]|nr:hypothetical protein [Stylosanthes scabra]
MGRNDDRGEVSSPGVTYSVFREEGSPLGAASMYMLDDRDIAAAHLHVLLNCDRISPFL